MADFKRFWANIIGVVSNLIIDLITKTPKPK